MGRAFTGIAADFHGNDVCAARQNMSAETLDREIWIRYYPYDGGLKPRFAFDP